VNKKTVAGSNDGIVHRPWRKEEVGDQSTFRRKMKRTLNETDEKVQIKTIRIGRGHRVSSIRQGGVPMGKEENM